MTDRLCTLHRFSSDNTSCLTPSSANLLQAGSLTVGDTSHPLYKGINIIGRESDDADRNRDRLVEWRVKHGGGVPVSALLLRFASISSKHAIICESETVRRDCCLLPGHLLKHCISERPFGVADMEANRHSFVEDLKARNKVGPFNGRLAVDSLLHPVLCLSTSLH